MRFFSEFGAFLLANKRLWLVPIVVVLVLAGVLIVLTDQSTIAPFVYTLF